MQGKPLLKVFIKRVLVTITIAVAGTFFTQQQVLAGGGGGGAGAVSSSGKMSAKERARLEADAARHAAEAARHRARVKQWEQAIVVARAVDLGLSVAATKFARPLGGYAYGIGKSIGYAKMGMGRKSSVTNTKATFALIEPVSYALYAIEMISIEMARREASR